MQKRFKKDFLKILKGYENLQESVLKISKNNLNDFRNNSEFLKGSFKSFKDTLKEEVESKDFSEDLNKNQFEVK